MAHRRYNPLLDSWVLVSPNRLRRPWRGRVEPMEEPERPAYSPDCYLCPGNMRANGERNPHYTDVLAFDNDYPALLSGLSDEDAHNLRHSDELLNARSERGICRVICFSPRHDLTIARMSVVELAPVIDLWVEEYLRLGSIEKMNHVQIFENHGIIMGCSNPHPHCQLWVNQSIPDLPLKKCQTQARWLRERGEPMLLTYVRTEMRHKERILIQNDSFVCLVPYWAVWPFEVMILPRSEHIPHIGALTEGQRGDLADMLHRTGIMYDNLFRYDFPYSMGVHQAPTDGEHPEWQIHISYYPPALRSIDVRKFMVGYELCAMPQRDVTPEEAARRLRELDDIHWLEATRKGQ